MPQKVSLHWESNAGLIMILFWEAKAPMMEAYKNVKQLLQENFQNILNSRNCPNAYDSGRNC